MRRAFADTSFFVALLSPKDELHSRALRVAADNESLHLVTSEMVLVDLLNDFGARGPQLRTLVCDFVGSLRRAYQSTPPAVTIVPQTPQQFDAALNTFQLRPDKGWSLTDCASDLIMQAQDIQEALTSDRHFEQMGYMALLR